MNVKTQTLRKYMRAAYAAASCSNDRYTHTGVVLVDVENGQIVAGGCNLIPECLATDPDRFERPTKYSYTEHAERTAIYLAAKTGVKTGGLWMFSTWAACEDCARAVIVSGIRHLVRHKLPEHRLSSRWQDSIDRGNEMLEDAGIEVIDLVSRVGVKNLFNGELIDA